ncbi:MAG: methylglyoxal synthase [Lachnospiraceae bacterium]|nr:methylglyoxal synthase [Lachnospiraceae bacterium]
MNIGFIADNTKKGLLEDFCIAYRGILMNHRLYATGTSGRSIERAANLSVYKFLAGEIGGDQQMALFIEQSQLDMLIVFKEPSVSLRDDRDVYTLFKQCDLYSIPLATNLATAEMLIKSLERGDLDWREIYRNTP